MCLHVSAVLLLISAPSGAGKTTVSQGLLEREPALRRVVTCTTRPPRVGERDGIDYCFLQPVDFARRVEAGQFLEHADVYGHRYGTLKSSVLQLLRAGSDVLLAIDVQGAASVRRLAVRDAEMQRALVTVFLAPATPAELEARLRGRNQDSAEVIARRLAAAEAEVAEAPSYDYLVVSRTREEDLAAMRAILAAERHRQHRVELHWGTSTAPTPTASSNR